MDDFESIRGYGYSCSTTPSECNFYNLAVNFCTSVEQAIG
jgi:hypothetical protein